MIRIANGQGFWGDWLEAPVRLVEQGPLDYLTLDYLAEVTMAILEKQRRRDPQLGYARDFPPLMARLEALLRERGVKVLANAGGLNPQACAREVKRLAPSLEIAVVSGDDVVERIDEFLSKGYEMRNIDTGEPLETIRDRILSASAYLGAFPLAEGLRTGADVVISGRCADAALAMGPMIERFGWREDDWDRLAAGVVAGHVLECGSQATGGNSQDDWPTIEDLDEIGYPIVEMEASGDFTLSKHAGTGGRVTATTVKEQILYEIGDPRRYITPDCVADFTSFEVKETGKDRVSIRGARGGERSDSLKVSINYSAGWKAVGTLVYTWPGALAKAKEADRIVRARLERLGLQFDEVYTEIFGAGACPGGASVEPADPPEVQLRIGVRGQDRGAVERFTRELIPLALSGPPGATGYGDGRPAVREVVAYWPTLVPRGEIRAKVERVRG
jgi:hypothetical protein